MQAEYGTSYLSWQVILTNPSWLVNLPKLRIPPKNAWDMCSLWSTPLWKRQRSLWKWTLDNTARLPKGPWPLEAVIAGIFRNPPNPTIPYCSYNLEKKKSCPNWSVSPATFVGILLKYWWKLSPCSTGVCFSDNRVPWKQATCANQSWCDPAPHISCEETGCHELP